jgi:hypothetical protein
MSVPPGNFRAQAYPVTGNFLPALVSETHS